MTLVSSTLGAVMALITFCISAGVSILRLHTAASLTPLSDPSTRYGQPAGSACGSSTARLPAVEGAAMKLPTSLVQKSVWLAFSGLPNPSLMLESAPTLTRYLRLGCSAATSSRSRPASTLVSEPAGRSTAWHALLREKGCVSSHSESLAASAARSVSAARPWGSHRSSRRNLVPEPTYSPGELGWYQSWRSGMRKDRRPPTATATSCCSAPLSVL
mmetsp:Transcript_14647/g.36472  ORF Transcript_14647/g.36472 Transcript_14647/m.36472 type:complete len:216 (+) Transcript_14647:5914-6561(+)